MTLSTRLALVAVCLLAAGCHGIEPNPTSPSVVTSPVTPTAIQIVVSPGQLPIGGGTATVLISTIGLGPVVAPAVTVNLRVDGGELSAASVTTDNTGHARVTWTGTTKATVTAESGSLTTSAAIKVNEPIVLPPNDPPPPRPPPPPEPLPTPAPQPAPLELTVSPNPRQVPVNTSTTFTAIVSNLQAGEIVLAYQWDWDGGEVFAPNETSAGAVRTHTYTTEGIKTPVVRATTSLGRSASATTTVFVVN